MVTFVAYLKKSIQGHKSMKTDKCNDKNKVLTNSYLTETIKQVTDGTRTLTIRLKPAYISDEECVESFQEAATLGRELKHPNILRIGQLPSSAPSDTEVPLEPLLCVTLEDYLHENPSFVTEGKELERIVSEVMEALDYLHGKGICQLDLHPRNILLTKSEKRVKLANSFFTYAHLTTQLGLSPNGFIAPELFSENPPEDLIACDIYALGKFISYLYDMGTLPYPYRKAVQLATDEDPIHRPTSIADFHRQIGNGRMMQLIYKGFAWTIAVLLAVGMLFWLTTSTGEEDIHFIEPTANNTYVYDSISGEEYYLNDSAMAVREAALEREKNKMLKEYDRKLNNIFKKEFRKKAIPVINEIYSQKHMDSETGIFTSVSTRGMQQLQQAQEELAKQYELDQISSSKVAAEVIEELTRQRMNELRKE